MKRLLLFPKSPNHSLALWRINSVIKGFLYLLTSLLYHAADAQSIRINGPAGRESFGLSVTVLTNGNYVLTDVLHNIPGVAHVGAVHLYDGKTHTLIQQSFGEHIGSTRKRW